MATQEQIDSLEQAIIEDVTGGIASVNVDGMTVVQQNPEKRVEVLERLRREQAAVTTGFGLRTQRLNSPGGWGG
jgi:hypothetical protein